MGNEKDVRFSLLCGVDVGTFIYLFLLTLYDFSFVIY